MKNLWVVLEFFIAVLVVCLIVSPLINLSFNKYSDRTFENGIVASSKVIGLMGHEEYSIFPNKMQIVKKYPRLSHRSFSSVMYIDFDGDNLIDVIYSNSSEMKVHCIKKILLREKDYETHKSEFMEGELILVKFKK